MKFNNKTDIWALGCIIYEIFAGVKAFGSTWSVVRYADKGILELPKPLHPSPWLEYLRKPLGDMFAITPSKRPRARDTLLLWERIQTGVLPLSVYPAPVSTKAIVNSRLSYFDDEDDGKFEWSDIQALTSTLTMDYVATGAPALAKVRAEKSCGH